MMIILKAEKRTAVSIRSDESDERNNTHRHGIANRRKGRMTRRSSETEKTAAAGKCAHKEYHPYVIDLLKDSLRNPNQKTLKFV